MHLDDNHGITILVSENNLQQQEKQQHYHQSNQKPKVSTKEYMTQFSTLVFKVQCFLDQNCIDKLDACKAYCSNLKISNDSDELLFVDEQLQQIDRCKTFRKLFIQLRQHWSWDEYSILQHIIDLAELEQSENELTKYKEFIAAKIGMEIIFDTLPELPDDAIKLSVTEDKPYSRLTRKEYEELKDLIFKTLQVRKYVKHPFIKVLFSSIHLDWYVPVQAANLIIKKVRTKGSILIQQSIVFLKVGDVVLVDQAEMQVSVNLAN